MPEITSFLGCFFTLKIQKKVLRQSQKCPNPLGTTRQTPCGVENHICDHFLGHERYAVLGLFFTKNRFFFRQEMLC